MTTSLYSQTLKSSRDMCDRAEAMSRQKAASGGDIGSLVSGQSGGMGGILGGGSQRKMQAAYAEFKNHVYTCTRAISTRLSGLPYGAGEIVNDDSQGKGDGKDNGKGTLDGTKGKVRLRVKNKLPATIKSAAGPAQIDAFLTHPALDVLNKPNPVQGKAEFLEQLVDNLYLAGEAYWIAGQGENGPELWMVPTSWIIPKHEGGLFTSFELKPPGAASGTTLDPETVRRMYFVDPADPKLAMSPVLAQISAIQTDNSIQKSQSDMFKRGIFPAVALRVGQMKDAEGKPGGMPRLGGAQRRQLIAAVRELWGGAVDRREPAIIDGLISGIDKLQTMPAEMDWLQSGEATKKRIFQAFQVNPIIVGEVTGANRAQAAVAEQHFLSAVINPLADRVTVVLNEFVAPMFGTQGDKQKATAKDNAAAKSKLYLWLEEGQPLDDELKLRKFQAGRQNGDVTGNEFRTEVLGLPPLETEASEKPALLSTVGGMTGTVQILSAVGMGQISPDSAVQAFMLFFGLDEATAKALVGDTGELGAAVVSEPKPPNLPPGRDTPQPDDEEDEDDPRKPKPEVPDVDENASDAGKAFNVGTIKRSQVKAAGKKQQARLEKEVAASLRPFSNANSARLLRSLASSPTAS
jgi:phage portal protein BeeE